MAARRRLQHRLRVPGADLRPGGDGPPQRLRPRPCADRPGRLSAGGPRRALPFPAPDAEGFLLGEPRDRDDLFVAYLEGIACLERLAYDTLGELGAEVGDGVFSAGGGSKSDAWLQIRADVLGRSVLRPELTGAAAGAAILAAGLEHFEGLEAAARAMVRIQKEVAPRPQLAAPYNEKFARFREECMGRRLPRTTMGRERRESRRSGGIPVRLAGYGKRPRPRTLAKPLPFNPKSEIRNPQSFCPSPPPNEHVDQPRPAAPPPPPRSAAARSPPAVRQPRRPLARLVGQHAPEPHPQRRPRRVEGQEPPPRHLHRPCHNSI